MLAVSWRGAGDGGPGCLDRLGCLGRISAALVRQLQKLAEDHAEPRSVRILLVRRADCCPRGPDRFGQYLAVLRGEVEGPEGETVVRHISRVLRVRMLGESDSIPARPRCLHDQFDRGGDGAQLQQGQLKVGEQSASARAVVGQCRDGLASDVDGFPQHLDVTVCLVHRAQCDAKVRECVGVGRDVPGLPPCIHRFEQGVSVAGAFIELAQRHAQVGQRRTA
ncbi:hypothetical protein DN051_02220 [Streptomyces cadmiisoli]|uniref:Uncharacterized protein n=1 Tax=Streptomyces cadmiisoli TaxID=2184053 RepID=A0A2Z4ITQ5_9ACTN|nr:hypothetical protein DN051_02220 [Streptomyces cadmiisoli]